MYVSSNKLQNKESIEDSAFVVSDDPEVESPIKKLTLSNNQAKSINCNALSKLKKLEKLTFNSNRIYSSEEQDKIQQALPKECDIEF